MKSLGPPQSLLYRALSANYHWAAHTLSSRWLDRAIDAYCEGAHRLRMKFHRPRGEAVPAEDYPEIPNIDRSSNPWWRNHALGEDDGA